MRSKGAAKIVISCKSSLRAAGDGGNRRAIHGARGFEKSPPGAFQSLQEVIKDRAAHGELCFCCLGAFSCRPSAFARINEIVLAAFIGMCVLASVYI